MTSDGAGSDGASSDAHSCCAPSRTPSITPEAVAPQRPPQAAGSSQLRGMKDIPGGEFRMGYDGPLANPSDAEGPVRAVTVQPFSIAETTVTNRQFALFVKATGHVTGAERAGWSFVFGQLVSDPAAIRGLAPGAQWWAAVDGASWRQPYGPGSDIGALTEHPVVHVDAGDVDAYCAWAGARLPTEAEWEFAARGGLEQAIYPWGDEHPGSSRRRRCTIWEGEFPRRHVGGSKAIGTSRVRSHAPNGYGLYQMSGNVWEWTADPWAGSGHMSQRRARRGGSYLCHDSYCNRYRVAARDHSAPEDSTGNIGFRVAA